MAEQLELPLGTQRWRHRRERWADPETRIDPRAYRVERIHRDLAKAFVLEHHYSGRWCAERISYGLYRGQELEGVAVFSQGVQQKAKGRYFPGAADIVELGRFVLLDGVKGDGETWFLRRSFGQLRQAIRLARRQATAAAPSSKQRRGLGQVAGVLSYSDPVPRTTRHGEVVHPGHLGIIYRGHNAAFFGRSDAKWHHLTDDGHVVSPRALSKIRGGEDGAEREQRYLLDLGAPAPWPGESPADWVDRALAEGPFRRFKHPGNLAYGWPLWGGVELAETHPYATSEDLTP